MFSCEYCEILKNTYFEKYLRTVVSDSETVPWMYSVKKMFLKILKISQKNTFAGVPFLLNLQAFDSTKMRSSTGIFLRIYFLSKVHQWFISNPLSANFTKWSNTLKQFVGNLLSHNTKKINFFLFHKPTQRNHLPLVLPTSKINEDEIERFQSIK